MKKLLITCLLAAFLLVTGTLWWQRGVSPVDRGNTRTQIFVIQKGEGIRSIAKRLKQEGLINDQIVFFILVKRLGLDGKIQAGDFRLSASMDAKTLARELTFGTLDVWVTIPEGLRSEEIAQVLKEKVPSYKEDWVSELKKHEGYLFPDTYLIPKDADVSLVVTIMRNNFARKWEELQSGKNMETIVILASIIEREAKFLQDRPLVASVLTNRLKLGMPLQADATIQYTKGKAGDWWPKVTKEDLKVSSPFNSYKTVGLTPSPIANPGFDSLKAGANPTATDYLYYLSDEKGHMHYAKTLDEHNRNIEKYL